MFTDSSDPGDLGDGIQACPLPTAVLSNQTGYEVIL